MRPGGKLERYRTMMQEERRQYSRKTLNPLPFINLPSGNGGIVLDVSEQGLRFRALGPVELTGSIRFWFTARSKLVAGVGEIVWFDEGKKTGGLRFTDLPYNALEQIRKWPHDADLQLSISKDLSMHMPARAVSPFPPPGTMEHGAQTESASRTPSWFDGLVPGSFESRIRESWLPALRRSLAELRALVPGANIEKQDRWIFKTSAALFLAVITSSAVYVRHRDAGELLIRMGTRLSGRVNTVTPAPTVSSQDALVDDGTTLKAEADVPVEQAVPPSVSGSTVNSSKEISIGTAVPQIQETPSTLPKPAISGTKLVVQVAALKEEVEARKLSDRLRQENFEAFVGTLPVDSFYRVMLGPYPDEASARVMLGKLKKAGFDSFIRRESNAERLGS